MKSPVWGFRPAGDAILSRMFKMFGVALILFSMTFPSFAQVPPGSPEERLFQAVWAGDMVKVQASLEEGANILAENSRRKTAVDLAADRGHYTIVRYLMQRVDHQKQQSLKIPTPATSQPAELDVIEPPISKDLPAHEPQIQGTGTDPFAPTATVQSGLTPAVPQPVPSFQAPPRFYPQAKPKKVVAVPLKKKPAPQVLPQAKPKPQIVVRYEPMPIAQLEKVAKVAKSVKPTKAIKPAKPTKKVVSRQDLNAALSVSLGKNPPEFETSKFAPCLKKSKTRTICIEKTTWSAGLFNHFSSLEVSIYKRFGSGGRAVVGYVGEKSTFIKTIFAVGDYDSVVEHFAKRYGKPDNRQKKIVAPLGKPQTANLVLSWYGVDPTTKRETVLQVIQYDTTQNRFAKMTEGAVIYKYLNERSVFSFVNPIELVRLP